MSVISQEEVTRGRYVYVRGVPASFCCLLLHGRLQIRAGNEGFSSEIGPWTTLALQVPARPTHTRTRPTSAHTSHTYMHTTARTCSHVLHIHAHDLRVPTCLRAPKLAPLTPNVRAHVVR